VLFRSLGYKLPHHPGQYRDYEWKCCKNEEQSSIGCHMGEVRHHTGVSA